MTVRLSFTPALQRPGVLSLSDESRTHPFESGYRAMLLNYETSRGWRRRISSLPSRKQTSDWYDPFADWYKIHITEDGIYRLDAAWFEAAGVALLPGDVGRLQVFVDGEEEPLLIQEDGDGELGEGEGILFYGRFRRQPDRDFENLQGRDHVYWLRVGLSSGRRYGLEDGSATGNLPEANYAAHHHYPQWPPHQ